MSTTVTQLLCNNFAGINRIKSEFSENKITCSDCQNVELYSTEMNSGTGIRTMKGNTLFKNNEGLGEGEKIIDIYQSVQDTITYCFVYTESEDEGKIYSLDIFSKEYTEIVGDLNVTGKSCATDFVDGQDDVFVFSNGIDLLKIQMNASPKYTIIEADDKKGEEVKGLGIKVYAHRIWIFHGNRLVWSYQGDCDDYSTSAGDNPQSAGLVDFSKNITAIYPYLGGLAVFFNDSSVLISGEYPFSQTDESPGGCAGYNSLVFHDTELYFYDNSKKGVYSFKQIVNGEKVLGQNIALEVQEELLSIDNTRLSDIRTLSLITGERNEIWFLIPTIDNTKSTILIYDYIHNEWLKRKSQKLTCFNIVNYVFYSCDTSSNILYEYSGDSFNGEYIKHYYKCSVANLGVDNALKILYFPPRVTLNMAYNNKFHVSYVRNYDALRRKKEKYINAKSLKKVLIYDSDMNYDSGWYYPPKITSSIYKLPSTTFKTLEIEVYTTQLEEDFCISNIEFSKIKIKQI